MRPVDQHSYYRGLRGENKRQRDRNLFEEIMVENVHNLGKKTDIQIQETQRIPNKENPRRPTARSITIKM